MTDFEESSPGRATRTQVLEQLRWGAKTVESLAAAAGVTRNAVRLHLAALERDGQVRRSGVRRGGSVGKPPRLYELTDRGAEAFSRAYPAALTALVEALADRLPPQQLRAVFDDVGGRLAAGHRPAVAAGTPEQRAAVVAEQLLVSLGATMTISSTGKQRHLTGASCPIAAVVRRCPDACEMVRSLLVNATHVPVAMECLHDQQPRCRFTLG